MTTERFVFDFDELDAQGRPYCPILEPYWPQSPTASGLLESIVGPFLRSRDRVRRILLEGTLKNLELAGDRMTAQIQYDGGDPPRIRGAVITGQSKPSEDRYPCGELYMLPGVGTVDLGDGQVLQARGIRIVPIREAEETYRERMDRLAVTAGTRLARNSPEGIAIMRATIAASPYQQCRKAHGCGHPCSCPKRNTTTVRKQP